MLRVLRVVTPFDLKIQTAIRRQRRSALQAEEEAQHIEGISIELSFKEEMIEQKGNRRALRNFALLRTQGSQTSITRPIVNAKNFELKLSLIQMAQQSQFKSNAFPKKR